MIFGTHGSLHRFRRQFGSAGFALLYHQIDYVKTRVRRRGLILSPRIFGNQLSELKKAGYQSLEAGVPLPKSGSKRALITFDDGFRNVAQHALPLLDQFGFQAMQFLVSDLLGGVNEWDRAEGERLEPLMNSGEVQEWLAAGHQIGAHTRTHPHLTRLSQAQAREEISGSKKALEDRFGRPVQDFAYPFGDHNETVRDLVAEAGFTRAWTTTPGLLPDARDLLSLPRLPATVSLRNPLHLLRSLPWPRFSSSRK